jgi:hypothetical protein
MQRYVLTSRWRLAASPQRVWQLLTDIERWPRWWRRVRVAHVIEKGREGGVGGVATIEWSSALALRIRLRLITTQCEAGRHLEALAEGDLRGRGSWLLEPTPLGAVDVTYRWDAVPTRPFMRHLGTVLQPVFEWNHFVVMRDGAHGMASHLGCSLSDLREFTATSRRVA